MSATRVHSTGMGMQKIGLSSRQHYYLAEHREAQKKTLAQVASLIQWKGKDGVALNTLWRWENEQHRLNPEKVAAVTHALGYDDPDILTRPPDARRSIDRMLESEPADVYEDVLKLVRRLTRKAS